MGVAFLLKQISRTVDILSWKFPLRHRSMLDVRTQLMDVNFYSSIELGGRGNFPQHLRPRLSELCDVTK